MIVTVFRQRCLSVYELKLRLNSVQRAALYFYVKGSYFITDDDDDDEDDDDDDDGDI